MAAWLKRYFKDAVIIYTETETITAAGEPTKTLTEKSRLNAFFISTSGDLIRRYGEAAQEMAMLYTPKGVDVDVKDVIKIVETGKYYKVIRVFTATESLKMKADFIAIDMRYNSEAQK